MYGIWESFSQYCALAYKFNFHDISLSGLVSWHMTSIFMDHISFRMRTTTFLLLTGVGITLQSGAHWNYLVSDQLLFIRLESDHCTAWSSLVPQPICS